MDKVYKADIPRCKKTLEGLKREFSGVHVATDWTTLRIEPLLQHVASLERLLRSPKFSRENARLRKGVSMFHADLVYLRANIRALSEILSVETRRATKRSNGRANTRGQPGNGIKARVERE